MFISRTTLNPQRRESKAAAANINRLHAQVLNAFPPNESGARPSLWRLDREKHQSHLYMVSHTKPDLRAIQEGYGWDSLPGETKDYTPLLDSIRTGGVFNFRMTGNPVHNREITRDNGVRVVRTPHRTPRHQILWLSAKGEHNGFELLGETRTTPLRTLSFTKRGGSGVKVTVGTVTFDGTLRVTDADEFRRALTEGVGRAKAYGCGLITVARA